MTVTTVAEPCRCIIETLKQVIVGKDEVLEQVSWVSSPMGTS